MSQSSSRLGLGLALVATLAATVWALTDDPAETDLVAERPARAQASAAPVPAASEPQVTRGPATTPISQALLQPIALGLPPRDRPPARRRDLFAAYGNAVPAPAPPAPEAAASQPQAISLPYGFGGRLVTAAGAAVLLNDSSQTHVLALGGTLGDFRLEQDNGAQLEFIHLPSGERLLLPTGP